jgi:hypothetical protein
MIDIIFTHETDDDGMINADLVVFADPVNTFGIKRNDTDQVLVPAGTPLPNLGPGIYQYGLVEPVSSLAYTYWIRWTFLGVTQSREFNVTGVLAIPLSIYFTWDEFVRRWGLKNIAIASNKQNVNANPDMNAVQDAFDYAYGEIQESFRGSMYSIPLSFVPNAGVVPPRVKRWAMIIAYADLYDVRGWTDQDRTGNKISKLLKNTYDEMGLYRAGVRILPAVADATSGGNLVVGAASVITEDV